MAKKKKKTKKSGPHLTPDQIGQGMLMGMNLQQMKSAFGKTVLGGGMQTGRKPAPKKANYDIDNQSLIDEQMDCNQYVLSVSLVKSPVKILRQLSVPSNLRLEHLAKITLRAMGWEDFEHMHQFTKGRTNYIYPCDGGFGFQSNDEDAMAYVVSDLLESVGDSIMLEYDFGDSWMHEVKLVKIDESHSELVIEVTAGQGACPPEDCGGVMGYRQVLKRLERYGRPLDEDDEDFDDMLDGWVGPGFDPEAFSVKDANQRIQHYLKYINE